MQKEMGPAGWGIGFCTSVPSPGRHLAFVGPGHREDDQDLYHLDIVVMVMVTDWSTVIWALRPGLHLPGVSSAAAPMLLPHPYLAAGLWCAKLRCLVRRRLDIPGRSAENSA